MTRLNKRDVEILMDSYDRDPVAALAIALGRVLDRPGAPFDALIDDDRISEARRSRLAARETAALDDLVRELNERRSLG